MDKPVIHYDKRIAKRSITKGDIKQEEYDRFIEMLPDRADASEPLNLEEEAAAPVAPAPALEEASGPWEAAGEAAPGSGAPAPERPSDEDDVPAHASPAEAGSAEHPDAAGPIAPSEADGEEVDPVDTLEKDA